MKIEVEYDVLSGELVDIDRGGGKEDDGRYGCVCVGSVRGNDLCMRDLGYFELKDVEDIEDKKG